MMDEMEKMFSLNEIPSSFCVMLICCVAAAGHVSDNLMMQLNFSACSFAQMHADATKSASLTLQLTFEHISAQAR